MTEKGEPHHVIKTDGTCKAGKAGSHLNTSAQNESSQETNKTRRATLLFKQLRPQTLVFDNQPRSTSVNPHSPLLSPTREAASNTKFYQNDGELFQHNITNDNFTVSNLQFQPARLPFYRGTRYRRKDVRLFQSMAVNDSAMILKSTFVIQAILNMLCQHIKDDEDQRKSLFMYMFKQLENLHVVSPLCADECFESIRNQYYDAFNLLILGFCNPDIGNQRNELVIAKRSISKEALEHSISVLGNFMPPDWSPMSFLQTSRYHSEFIEESKLGSGGFGEVYKVKNRVDEKFYAVKKIRLQLTNASALKAVQREVQLMAPLRHENIVMYYGAWWEQSDLVAIENQNLDALDSSSSADTPFRSNGKPSSNWCSHHSKKLKGLPVMLYVQMELCGMTLERFLKERNQNLTLRKFADNLEIVDPELSDNIFRQLLIAVSYIHSQSLMHRDLKPSNVFLDDDGRGVKIGDFGLARSELINIDIEEVPSTPLTPFSKYANKFTAKLGTGTYAAPEQLEGSNYSKKADMYSLGLIYFELLFPFGDTAMERSKTLEHVRKAEGFTSEVESIAKRWPNQAGVIRHLLLHDPERRPTAAQLLANWSSKSDKDIIRELKEQLKEKENTIKSLNRSLTKQRHLINRLCSQNRKLQKCNIQPKDIKANAFQ